MASTFSLFSPAELSFAQVPLAHSAATSPPSSSSADPPPLRLDGRSPLQYRDIVLETGFSHAQGALGSARVVLEDAAGAGGGGATEVVAGVRGEVDDMAQGSAGGKVIVSLECAPTALPALKPDLAQHLATLLSTLFSPSALPRPLLSQLVVLPGSKAWTLHLDVLVLSSAGGNASDAALLAARAALASARLPATRSIGFDDAGDATAGGEGMTVDEGFSGLVKGGKSGTKAVDFELVDGGEGGVRLAGWEDLPVGLTLNLINQLPHLDATTLEEAASSSQLLAGFTPSGAVCGLAQLGEGEVEFARVMPLLSDAGKYAQDLLRTVNAKLRDA